MKKAILILLVGLFWCNVGFAEDIYLSCKGGTSFIINDKTKKIIMDIIYQIPITSEIKKWIIQ